MTPPHSPEPCNQVLPPFDELVALAKHHPDAFDQFKKEMCEEMILSASHAMQQRLWAQQSHIGGSMQKPRTRQRNLNA